MSVNAATRSSASPSALLRTDLTPFAGRLVYVTGKTDTPAMRDRSRQQGSPKPSEKGDEKGHVIATSLGGGMDINLIPQARDVNRGKGSRWAAIERELAAKPGSAVAIRLVYSDDSQRPASFEFGHESDSGFQIEQIDNPKSP
jgi:DNA/RNA non-specific endonuclease